MKLRFSLLVLNFFIEPQHKDNPGNAQLAVVPSFFFNQSAGFGPNPQQDGRGFFGLPQTGFGRSGAGEFSVNNPFSRIQSLEDIDWSKIDRREEEGWWNLYPFGEKYFDLDMGIKPWKDLQIDLEFYFPYCGFRFNYTFIYPEGFIAFDRPRFIQPPYSYPNPRWPEEPDPSFIATFLMEQNFAHIGEIRLSHVWYRIISRPQNRFLMRDFDMVNFPQGEFGEKQFIATNGRVEDGPLLDRITRDIREGMVGSRGYTANYALIVTWERMGYGGQPKFLAIQDYERTKRWLNTYQLVITSDEVRSYVVMNYARINYTSSSAAGALMGRGGRQSALVGFNAGNGTGFTELPYSAQGDSYKLMLFGATETTGRWLARVDESVQYGGCSNASTGVLMIDAGGVNMIGGTVFNVSGPCFRPHDYITMEVDEEIFDCGYVNMVKATCTIPFNMVFKAQAVTIQITQDGRNYAWYRTIYMFKPAQGSPGSMDLLSSLNEANPFQHDWHRANVENLTLKWSAANISTILNSRVDITLWGYYEDVLDRDLIKVGAIARSIPNTGKYSFDPRFLDKTLMKRDAWKKFWGGVIQVRVADHTVKDRGNGLYWSKLVPFGWYFYDIWRQAMGDDWALRLCIDWFEMDGRRYNFYEELEQQMPCPCTLVQAQADFGRFLPLPDCDMHGDSSCFYTRGAQHCVMATGVTMAGANQACCYDFNGWLIFSQDYEYHQDYIKYGSAGAAYRAHPWGGYRYKKPPHVPSWSNFYNDLLPYDICCRWAGHCEFYYWRRMTSGCQNYKPPRLASAYGYGHFITYDNLKYTFNGRGYFVLTSFNAPGHSLMVQIRMEQPPKTVYNSDVPATVITGVVVQDNDSSVVHFLARKQHRRWRYAMDLHVDDGKVFLDNPVKKYMHFVRASIFTPHLNKNQSDVTAVFPSGVGVRVLEMDGHLQVIVALPPGYNESLKQINAVQAPTSISRDKCSNYHRTQGLFGPYNGDLADDLTGPDCNVVRIGQEPNEMSQRQLYHDFGLKWAADDKNFDRIFSTKHPPIYYPNLFSKPNFLPVFDPWRDTSQLLYESLAFSRNDEVRFACQSIHSCMFDYIMGSRRHDALNTLSAEKKFEGLKSRGEKHFVSCGPLQKSDGVVKVPLGNNYLDGVTVTFSCKIEYFLHGAQQRYCNNGTWSHGWWAWCRSRTLEYSLKWLTGIIVSLGIVAIFSAIFIYLNRQRQRKFMSIYPNFQQFRNVAGKQRKHDLRTGHTPDTITYEKKISKPREASETGFSSFLKNLLLQLQTNFRKDKILLDAAQKTQNLHDEPSSTTIVEHSESSSEVPNSPISSLSPNILTPMPSKKATLSSFGKLPTVFEPPEENENLSFDIKSSRPALYESAF